MNETIAARLVTVFVLLVMLTGFALCAIVLVGLWHLVTGGC